MDWEQRYRDGNTPWDLDAAPPVLEDLVASLGPTPLRVLVPGVGSGHDAIAWARAGHQVTAFDVAPLAVTRARQRVADRGLAVEVLEADLFALPVNWDATFDIVWEQTCFCAIEPVQRGSYVAAMARVLHPDGTYYGLFWNHGMPGGPPWDVTEDEVRAVFPPRFVIASLEPVTNSVPGRHPEFLTRMQRA